MRYRCRRFSMIEMVLALGVVAIGMVSIMALFPVGMNASRDGMADAFAADACDQFLHQLDFMIRHTTNGWTTYVTDGGIPDARPTGPETVTVPIEDWDETLTAANETLGTILVQDRSNPGGWYRLIRYGDRNGNNIYDVGSSDILDFEADMVVWREQVTLPLATPVTLDWDVAVALNIEVSWPATLDYGLRKTSTFRYELFNR